MLQRTVMGSNAKTVTSNGAGSDAKTLGTMLARRNCPQSSRLTLLTGSKLPLSLAASEASALPCEDARNLPESRPNLKTPSIPVLTIPAENGVCMLCFDVAPFLACNKPGGLTGGNLE
jgi:hypothetical protein